MLSNMLIGEHMEYLSSDSVEKPETIDNHHFNSITLPNHSIKLKVESPIMFLRNLDRSVGLCNDTKLIVAELAKHVIVAKIISRKNIGNKVSIPKMSTSPSQSP